MTQAGFFERKTVSPSGFALVVALHAAALAAVILMKGPQFIREHPGPLITEFIPLPDDPPPEPPQPQTQDPVAQRPTVIDRVDPVIERPREGPVVTGDPPPPLPPLGGTGEGPVSEPVVEPPPLPAPVRIAAQVDPRFAGDLQPAYPTAEQRAEREGTVRVRVTIGADGRVKAIERISATSDAFWEATRRHALARWRFRPATEDGRPVASRKTMNVFFELRT
ncbi:MAG TPA: energy transducer TonB [Allosphingosinicella sp.]|nr:energy transducer TonB [Allosphingosinicella sp.]